MNRIVIGWRVGPFTCEFRDERSTGSLQIFRGDELMLKETSDSIKAAFERAREVCEQEVWRQARGA
jgi:hypothetical protein